MQSELKQVVDLALFAKIVQMGGISKCAADLGMERTTVSRHLSSLERQLGVKLLDRTPKHIAVTDAGRRCLEQCEMLLESAQNATSMATVGAVATSTAPIVVGAPPDMIDRYLERQILTFESDNPRVSVELKPVSVWHEDAVRAVDIGIALSPVDVAGGWTSIAGHVTQSIFASKEYTSRHGAPRTPLDLEVHDCIVEAAECDRNSWRFGYNENLTKVRIKAKYVVSSLLEAREAALAGLGVCRLPQYLCESYLRTGSLVDLMPDIESAGRDVVIISPRARQRKPGTAALRMHLESGFRN